MTSTLQQVSTVCPVLQSIQLQSSSLFAAEAASRGPDWRSSSVADVPGANLLKAGYALIAREPLLEVDIRPPIPSAEGKLPPFGFNPMAAVSWQSDV